MMGGVPGRRGDPGDGARRQRCEGEQHAHPREPGHRRQKNWMWLMKPNSAASGRLVCAFGLMKYWKSGANVTPR